VKFPFFFSFFKKKKKKIMQALQCFAPLSFSVDHWLLCVKPMTSKLNGFRTLDVKTSLRTY
jgi:hypothetical protein